MGFQFHKLVISFSSDNNKFALLNLFFLFCWSFSQRGVPSRVSYQMLQLLQAKQICPCPPALVVQWGQTQKRGQVQVYSRKTGGQGRGPALRGGRYLACQPTCQPPHTEGPVSSYRWSPWSRPPAGADGHGECVQPCHPPHCLCRTTGLLPRSPSGSHQAGHQEEEECHPEVSAAAHTSLHNHPQWKDQLRFEQL